MRVWTKSACAVLAWVVLLTIVVAGLGMRGTSPAQAQDRNAASTTQVTPATLTVATAPTVPAASAASAASAAPAATPAPGAGYVVRSGDTLSGIAEALGIPGGWPALYAANRHLIGPDPGLIRPGMTLTVPGARPAHYTVASGDTLSQIAVALGVPGGWPALYAANRHLIGPDPNLIRPGIVLTVTWPGTPAATHPARPPAAHQAPPASHPRPATTPAPVRKHAAPARSAAPAQTGMPSWLRTMLIAVGLLIGAAFLAELVPAIARRRRPPGTEGAQPEAVPLNEEAGAGSLRAEGEEARIFMADYDRLVVTHSKADDIVCVLRPPGSDPRAILRVARLVLTEDPYEKLADRLGVPASWPME